MLYAETRHKTWRTERTNRQTSALHEKMANFRCPRTCPLDPLYDNACNDSLIAYVHYQDHQQSQLRQSSLSRLDWKSNLRSLLSKISNGGTSGFTQKPVYQSDIIRILSQRGTGSDIYNCPGCQREDRSPDIRFFCRELNIARGLNPIKSDSRLEGESRQDVLYQIDWDNLFDATN